MAEQTRTYREGDLVRVTNANGDRIEGRLRKSEDGRLTLGAYQWTFPQWITENAGFSKVEVLERANPLPTEPGLYRDAEGDLWSLKDNGEWYFDGTVNSTSSTVGDYMPLTRLYTKDEVLAKARTAAFESDPDYFYGGPENNLVKALEATL